MSRMMPVKAFEDPVWTAAEMSCRIDRPGWSLVFTSEDIRRPSDWRIQDRWHTVIFHLGGRMDSLETELDGHGGSCGPALAGEIWTVPSGRRYAACARGGKICYAVLSIDPDAESGGWELNELAGARDESLHALVQRVGLHLVSEDEICRDSAGDLSTDLLGCLRGRHGKGDLPRPERWSQGRVLAAPAVRRLRRCIHARLAERLCLDELAIEAGVGTHQLLIGFRQAFGTTPAQYIIGQRIRAARYLLATTGRDITSIALEVGFSSHSHLTRTFRQQTGVTPSKVRADCGFREDP